MKPFFVYMLRCADDSYYVGHTDDLERRIASHQAGEIDGYTKQHGPVELVWSQETTTRAEALEAERRIKGWARAKKEALIRGDWKAIERHAWGTRNPLPEHLRDDAAGASIPQPERTSPVRPEVSKALREQPPAQPEVSKARADLAPQVLTGSRRAIAKSITLLESTRPDHRIAADELLNALLPHTGKSLRLGISGVPGVGKSTFIEILGLQLIERGHRVAVLTIDPSSSISGGSILGDKTRMERLSVNDAAYIRPSPASGTLGGVAEKTREAMLVCEAAGYDIVIVETVGVGQSETAVASMTDMFVLLQLPNAGDDLQAIKKGVMELADLVVINKADIDPDAATRAEATITSALRIFGLHGHAHWVPKVIQISALKGQGIAEFWQQVQQFRDQRSASGELDARRRKQALSWMWDLIHARLQSEFRHHPAVRDTLADTVRDVAEARVAPSAAARALLERFAQR